MDWFKLSDLSEKLGIPYQSLARYVQRHSQHLKLKKEHKSSFIHNDSIVILEQIRELYQKGFNEKQVDRELSIRGIPITINVSDDNELITLDNTLKSMHDSLLSLHEKIDNQEKFNQELVKQLQKQEDYMNNRLIERDKALMFSLKETLEMRQQVAVTNEKKWWKFWK